MCVDKAFVTAPPPNASSSTPVVPPLAGPVSAPFAPIPSAPCASTAAGYTGRVPNTPVHASTRAQPYARPPKPSEVSNSSTGPIKASKRSGAGARKHEPPIADPFFMSVPKSRSQNVCPSKHLSFETPEFTLPDPPPARRAAVDVDPPTPTKQAQPVNEHRPEDVAMEDAFPSLHKHEKRRKGMLRSFIALLLCSDTPRMKVMGLMGPRFRAFRAPPGSVVGSCLLQLCRLRLT